MDQIRLVATDMDATLLDEKGELPPGFTEMVRSLDGLGICVAAASGRPIYTLEAMFASLQEEMVFIGDNGGAIRWRGENLYVSEMAPQGWRGLAAIARETGDCAVLCGLDRAYIEKRFDHYDSVMRRFYTSIDYVESLGDVEAVVDKFSIYFPNGNAREGYDALYGPACADAWSVAVAGPEWVDITNPGVHKGAALNILGQKLQIPASGMMAFGDAYNDLEMLCAARYGFLMENGMPELRDRVPFLAPSNREYGVMQILQRVLEQGGLVSQAMFLPRPSCEL